MDGTQAKDYAEKIYQRFTNGLRVVQKSDDYTLSITGYWQHGKNAKGTKLNAWYLNPEGQYKYSQFNFRAGLKQNDAKMTITIAVNL